MITILPDFYDRFQCKAGNCLHSCCKGWEIDIDEATAQRYSEDRTPFGEELRKHIQTSEEGASFILTEDERCPFLQENGLCRLILAKGEDILCDICTNHPRFFTYLGKLELAGVGLCCEEACSLLLSSGEELRFCTEDGERFFTLAELLEEFGIPFAPEELVFSPETAENAFDSVMAIMRETEPIKEAWTEGLKSLERSRSDILSRISARYFEYPEEAFNRIYQMLLYRQLEMLETEPMGRICEFAHINTQFIFYAYMQTGDLAESLRSWSEQIEYDTDNVEIVYEKIGK